MKSLFFIAFTFFCFSVFAQAPQPVEPEAEKKELREASQVPQIDEVVKTAPQPEAPAQIQPVVEELTGLAKVWAWIKDNLLLVSGLVLGLGELIAKAFPTEKNQARFEWLLNFFDVLTGIFGNNKTGGGQHNVA
jgi:hypothetical protein